MIKVLYVGGTGRTGSTLLDKMLGQFEGVFAGGELAFFWRHLTDGRCSCGQPLRSCPTWDAVLEEAFGAEGIDAAEMVSLRRRFHSVHLPLMVSRGLRSRRLARLGPFPARVGRLYEAIGSVTGSRMIVDSSKEPHYSYILRSLPNLDVYFLHLVRDPRAVAYSWQRHRTELGLIAGGDMERRGPVVSGIYYDVSNTAAHLMWRSRPDRYLRLRYEDFVRSPRNALETIGAFVGEEFDPSSIEREGAFDLQPIHSAWGNPNRFDSGLTRIEPDTQWRQGLPRRHQLVAMAMTFPFLFLYGYWRAGTIREDPGSHPFHDQVG